MKDPIRKENAGLLENIISSVDTEGTGQENNLPGEKTSAVHFSNAQHAASLHPPNITCDKFANHISSSSKHRCVKVYYTR